jgi:hypothetical protein
MNKPQQAKTLFIWMVMLAIVAGCQRDSSTNPAEPSSSVQVAPTKVDSAPTLSGNEESSFGTSGLLPIRGLLRGITQTVTRLVTPILGGTLNLSHSSLVVQPLAVLTPTLVRFSMTAEAPEGLPGALPEVYDFFPEGLNFLVPSTLYVSFTDAGLGNGNPYEYTFYYFNGTTWEPQPTEVDMQHHQFVVNLHHFSRYAFGR